jgi:hypothetical protein
MDSHISTQVAEFLGLNEVDIVGMAQRAPHTYRHYKIPKKSGRGMRTIHHPSKETKSLQYALMHLLEDALQPHGCATAYIKRASPLRRNAEIHATRAYLLRVDFKDFFPSIQPADVFAVLEDERNQARFTLSMADKDFLTSVLFAKNSKGLLGLPIGAPSSPLVSNGVMRTLDSSIESYAKSRDFLYTRYADDLVFSTDQKGLSRPFLEGLREVISRAEHPRLEVNEEKTLFMSRNCRRAVTGLIIGPDGSLSIGRKRKRYIRKLLQDFRRHKLSEKECHHLQGHLAFILDAEPSFFDRLCLKYGAENVVGALKMRGDRFAARSVENT